MIYFAITYNKDKSAHNEIRDFYAHMALTDERRFVRCFCRYLGNIAMRSFLDNKISRNVQFRAKLENKGETG